jgi:hypothetical protein
MRRVAAPFLPQVILCYPSVMNSSSSSAKALGGSFLAGVLLALFGVIGGVGAITPDANGKPANLTQYDSN